ncbi:hypothetical protein DTO006G1_8155 [Penicillium roqueforti]|nr:hypothetical protein CBS147337_6647 [Penicillium roqueforti]KAI2696909.1 hypothetical protein CBS147332_8872 [Penicillium roqueforti]KAI2714420.1 hypothetical protein CBS147318_6574 [Penicillium roqueforti]KAI2755883.1 hypothetical protein DTO006G1_8155 [Penicillium roqueforti]KAI3103852.1 hypothetical protein CBS147331_7456 [Penicillium roqueforti]
MRTLARAAIAIALILTLFWVKSHLESILQWRNDEYNSDLYVLNGDAYIELVSAHTATPATPSHTQTRRKWSPTARPTPRLMIANPEPERIPVDVPGAEWAGELWFRSEEEPEFYDSNGFDDAQLLAPVEHNDVMAPSSTAPSRPKVTPKSDRIIILGKMSYEDTDWLEDQLPEWQHAVYLVDDPEASLQVEQNKGKESSAYLQYILDNYDKLPEYMVFLHAHQYSGHVEFWEQDNVLTVQRLQLDYLRRVGYLNLRCDWSPGCPDEVQPFRQTAGRTTELAFAGAWIRIFNNTDVPEIVATPCCAQFAVTREQVLQRPRTAYESYHNWLMTTELDDETSGRVFEYIWHIIFGQDPVFCPEKAQCYKDVYAMDYEESAMNFFDDDIWGNWYDEAPMDEIPMDEIPIHPTPVKETPVHATPTHTTPVNRI